VRFNGESVQESSIEIRCNAWLQTNDFERANQSEKQIEAEERLRTYYVALTRAQRKLVVTAHFLPKLRSRFGYEFSTKFLDPTTPSEILKVAKFRPWSELRLIDKVHTDSGSADKDSGRADTDSVRGNTDTGTVGIGISTTDTDSSTADTNASAVASLSSSTAPASQPDLHFRFDRKAAKVHANSIIFVAKNQLDFETNPQLVQLLNRATVKSAGDTSFTENFHRFQKMNVPDLGLAVHRGIELSQLRKLDSSQLEELWASEMDFYDSATRELLIQCVSEVLDHPLIERAARSSHYFLELPMLADTTELFDGQATKPHVLSGRADLVFQNPDSTWTILDFKNTLAMGKKFENERNHYLQQLVLYAYLFEKATGEKVSELILLYALGGPAEFSWSFR
jgi:ATP-dependent exoDNAse (exonuclease V) beta subunit